MSGDVFMMDLGDLEGLGVKEHKGVPLYPGVGDFKWRHEFQY